MTVHRSSVEPSTSVDTRAVDLLCKRVIEITADNTIAPDPIGNDRGTAGLRDVIDLEARHVAPLASPSEQSTLANAAYARLSGVAELDTWMHDPNVDEVLVNANNDIWVDRNGSLTHVGDLASQPLINIVERILAPIGRRCDQTAPVVDARLPDGSRVCAVVAPVSVDGTCLSIRRFSSTVRPLDEFTDNEGLRLIREIVDARCNVVVTGATSSGKTSLLASILDTLPTSERIVVIEDTAELPLGDHHVVRLEARPPSPDGPPPILLTDLVRTALRLRPDRLVVGEIRGDEVLGMVQAMNTGHDGSFSTCHANSALDALYRLESLVLRAAPTWPMAAIRDQLARSVDIIVHVGRHTSGRRLVDSVAEVVVDREPPGPPAVRILGRTTHGVFQRVATLERRR